MRRGVTFVISAALHVAVFFIAFSGAAGSLVSGGGGSSDGADPPVYAVTLLRVPAQELGGDAPSQLRMKIRQDAAEGIAVAERDRTRQLAALAERLTQRAAGPKSVAQLQTTGVSSTRDGDIADRGRGSLQASFQGKGEQALESSSTGALWGAIEPCWRNLGYRGQVPVVIEVAFDRGGRIQAPPKVVRATAALLNEPRLRSEANALAALTACLPRTSDLRVAANTYRLEFPATN